MLLLGLGLGMVMQVLILAAQNAAKYEHLGVATSGVALFRSIGGSLGVALFGGIFASALQRHFGSVANLAGAALNPEVIQALPPGAREPYVAAFAAALNPVFATASGIAFAVSSHACLARSGLAQEFGGGRNGRAYASRRTRHRSKSCNASSPVCPGRKTAGSCITRSRRKRACRLIHARCG